MTEDLVLGLFIGTVVVMFIASSALRSWWRRRKSRRGDDGLDARKAEAFFQASFPELQPLFHPQAVVDYVLRRQLRQFTDRDRWENPAGFPSAALARFEAVPKGERTHLFDKAGRKLAEFVLEPKEGALGALRVGAGKFTIRQAPGQPPRVSYWHPEREFQWRGPGQWRFVSRVADEPVDTTDRSWSSSRSDSSSTGAATAAAAAGVAGLGGSFDGGGASAGWDGPDGASASGGSASDSGDSSFASVSSGSSSTADASDSSGSSSDTSY
jgi:uncharacterized membrane protein YgcG